VSCFRVEDPARISSSMGRYLRDESGLVGGLPRAVFMPETPEQVRDAVLDARARGGTLTVSGARTGIVGGAVPVEGGDLLILERLGGRVRVSRSPDGVDWIAEAPVSTSVEGLRAALDSGDFDSAERPRGLFYPVDPTEGTASLGGNAATNASGARTLFYGPTRNWVLGLTVVLADGAVARLVRGEHRAAGGVLRFPVTLPDGSAGEREVRLPALRLPETKHAAGYHVRDGMDARDLFIGAEGTLGIVTGIRLILRPKPAETAGVSVFLPDEQSALALLRLLKTSAGFVPTALEYLDGGSLRMLEAYRREAGKGSGVPVFPEGKGCMLFVEASGSKGGSGEILEGISGILRRLGVQDDCAWAGLSPEELDAMRALRHALPERINALISRRSAAVPGLAKLATDLAVPDSALAEMMKSYGEVLSRSGLSYALFGHIGNAHLHMNILPESAADVERGCVVCGELARRAVALGGSVSGEHGIGRLKKHLLAVQYTSAELDGLRSVKHQLDPLGLLNPGVMW
jgi:D-lactate dehydrogenase (cytochrome)